MKRAILFAAAASCCPPDAVKVTTPTAPKEQPKELALPQEVHLKNVRQLTFGGDNAEAYWAFGGDRLILQSNRKPYECDQIEVLSTTGGEPKLVSTGKGRTTCAYFLKGDKEIVYASTHEAGPKCPTPPDNSKGYMWGLFEYDIYKANADGTNLVNLTPKTPGYDGEATVCPVDGSIIFTSTRTGDLELFRMDADGKNVRQLTNLPGYDGGAFFSADCKKIVWRSSRPQGKDLEDYKALLAQNLVKPTKMDLYVANADGSDARQVTYLAGAAFAPFFYPDGKRIIFSSNWQNPRSGEFDLFAIDIDGANLEQITFTGGFDGFPVFSPDGKTLAFSSNRRDVVKKDGKDTYRITGAPAGERDTNVFLADWVEGSRKPENPAPETSAAGRFTETVTYLADDAREGRGVGTKGLVDSIAYVQKQLEQVGVEAGLEGWRQEFEVTTEVKRGDPTAMMLDGAPLTVDDFAPMPISGNGTANGGIVAVGWGIADDATKIDDYKGKNVRGKIVLVHRFAPSNKKLEPRDIQRLGDLRYKAFVAKQRGAIGVIAIDDGDAGAPPAPKDPPKPPTPAPDAKAPAPDAKAPAPKDPWAAGGDTEAPLPKLSAAESQAGIPVVVVTRKAGAALRKGNHTAKLTVALEAVRAKTHNLVGVIKAGAATKLPGIVVVGAHLDHLGHGGPSALDPGTHAPHNGADDNASGIAGLIEVARVLAAKKSELQRDIYVVAFSAEEMGTLGSEHYVKHPPSKEPIVAMLNMDMIGRMKMNQLFVNGGDSAKEWKELVEPACAAQKVSCTVAGSGYGPSDHMPFYIAGVPVLFMFTGSHREYHTAKDDVELINAAGGARVAAITAEVAHKVANRPGTLSYVKAAPEAPMTGDVRKRGASLGTVPGYGADPNAPKGMTISDVVPDGPAAKAGLKAGDRIIQLGTAEIASVADLMIVLEQAKPGTEVKVTFVRDNKIMQVTATYGMPRSRR
ncbi:MAG: M20/M25/M40 family metallo-hydrolase [Deltaproteobacteria bacterium]|nr:M20/M25/M40 family metallo-hydrolase [Deltaproteobacteria bacterium]